VFDARPGPRSRANTSEEVDPASSPWPSPSSPEHARRGEPVTRHALFKGRNKPAFSAPEGDSRPPRSGLPKGGPHLRTTRRLKLEIQLWTSRGFWRSGRQLWRPHRATAGSNRERRKGRWESSDVTTHGRRQVPRRSGRWPCRPCDPGLAAPAATRTLCALTSRTIFAAGAATTGRRRGGARQGYHKFEPGIWTR